MSSHEELLQHADFLRGLARSLVSDAHGAEDLAQDTWVVALERRPGVLTSVRGWLSRVARSRAADGFDRAARRDAAERAAARPEAKVADVGAHLELQRRMVEALEALGEPYRAALYLRYHEGLGPSEIAARTGVPVGTVKTRLKRGLAQLRETLDRTAGGRQAWRAGLAAGLPQGLEKALPTPEAGAITQGGPWIMGMGSKVLVGLGAGAILVAGGLWMRATDAGSPSTNEVLVHRPPAIEAPEPTHAPAEPAALHASEPVESERVEVASSGSSDEQVGETQPAEPVTRERPARPEEEDLVLVGRVVHAFGGAAGGARVRLGPHSTKADTAGRFWLDIGDQGVDPMNGGPLDRDQSLIAVLEGFAPAILVDFGQEATVAAREGREILLELPGPAGWIRGHVLGADGGPAAGWRIKILDGTVIARGAWFPLLAEDVAAEPEGFFPLSSHEFSRGPQDRRRMGFQLTDEDGAFAFGGLDTTRDYRLRAWNPQSLEIIESDPIAVGTSGVVLQASLDPPRPVVDGRVVGRDGLPIADVRCRLTMVEHRSEGSSWMTTGQQVHTDAEGRFRFVDVPHTEIFIRFNAPGAGGTSLDLEPGEVYRDVEILILRPGTFSFTASDPASGPDHVAVEGPDGERMRLNYSPKPGTSLGTGEVPVIGGRTGTVTVGEEAQLLLLLREGVEIGRVPLHLLHGELVEIVR